MTRIDCPHTAAVLAAHRAGTLAPATADSAGPIDPSSHAAACAACADALTTDRALHTLGATLARQASLPNAAQILFRAHLRQTLAVADDALRPVRLWNRVVSAGCVAGAGAFLYFRGDALLHLFHGDALFHVVRASADGIPPLLLVAAGASLGLVSLLLVLHASWTES